MKTQFIRVKQFGYVIFDLLEQRPLLSTFASNRKDAWDAWCDKDERDSRKRMGFACVFVSLDGQAAVSEKLVKEAERQRVKQ